MYCMNTPLSLYNDFETLVLRRIKNIMKHRHVSQAQLVELSDIPQTTLSKLLSGNTKLSLPYLAQICSALGIDPSSITSLEETSFDDMSQMYDKIYKVNNSISRNTFTYNTDELAFKGFPGTYYFYSYSTISTESSLLHGIFNISNSRNGGHCEVSLDLYTGSCEDGEEELIKKYAGEMIISLPMSTCYCIMTNPEIGEMFFLAFHHMFAFHKKIKCRVALGISTSSGGNRRPIAQRILLSRTKLNVKELSSKDSLFIQGQLLLNSTNVLISQKAFDTLLTSDFVIKNEGLYTFLTECKKVFEKENFYRIDESILRGIDTPTEIKIQGISLLRKFSSAPKYNKISTKTDEYTYSYLMSKDTHNSSKK